MQIAKIYSCSRDHLNYLLHSYCRNPSLGFVTKARACKGVSQEGSLGDTFYVLGNVGECEGMNSHTPKWAPLWELESQWTPKFSKRYLRGQNS